MIFPESPSRIRIASRAVWKSRRNLSSDFFQFIFGSYSLLLVVKSNESKRDVPGLFIKKPDDLVIKNPGSEA